MPASLSPLIHPGKGFQKQDSGSKDASTAAKDPKAHNFREEHLKSRMSAQENDNDDQHQPQGEEEGEQPVSAFGPFAPEGKTVVRKCVADH